MALVESENWSLPLAAPPRSPTAAVTPWEMFANIALGLVVLCALVVTALVVRRELLEPAAGAEPTTSVLDDSLWNELVSAGHRRGDSAAKLTIVEFADFECPVCRRYSTEVLAPLMADSAASVAVLFRHWPLPYHRFAYPTARASECAALQSRFFEFHDLLFLKQDSLGLKPLDTFAIEAGVQDIGAFSRCTAESGILPNVERDAALAKAIKGRGTPTIVANGILFDQPPGLDELRALAH
jgi:hypothetical protein